MDSKDFFLLPSEILWGKEFDKNPFFPKIEKRLIKYKDFFAENFTIDIYPANIGNFQTYFWPLYEKIVLSKDDCYFDKNFVEKEIEENLKNKDRKYSLLVSRTREGGLVGMILFFIQKDFLYVQYRAIEKDVSRNLGINFPLSYHIDKFLEEYCKSIKISKLFHGHDYHPYEGLGTIGVVLYKMKVGCLPFSPTYPHTITTYTKEILEKKNIPCLFFTDEKNGQYTSATLFHGNSEIDAFFLHDLEDLCNFLKINFLKI